MEVEETAIGEGTLSAMAGRWDRQPDGTDGRDWHFHKLSTAGEQTPRHEWKVMEQRDASEFQS